MPPLFPTPMSFVLACAVMLVAQLIYATVGFGAGMVSIAFLAMLLPDFTGAVAVLLLLTFVTEASVLLRHWRKARLRLLIGLAPAMIVGLWLGTQTLVSVHPASLKQALGLFIGAAGVWFLYRERRSKKEISGAEPGERRSLFGSGLGWASLIGLTSGFLGGLFGTGGPPVIAFLKHRRLDKGVFRATLLLYFMSMSLFRTGAYVSKGILTWDVLMAGLWLLPPSALGMILGMRLHNHISERAFGIAVSGLLVVLGGLLVVDG